MAITNICQKYSVEKFGKIIQYIYIFFIIFIKIIHIIIYLKHTICGTFLLNIYLHFIWYGNFMWDKISLKARAFGSFLWSKMSGLVNSSLYCYFNSLIQSLSNCSNVQRLLQEHSTTIETGSLIRFNGIFWGNMRVKNSAKIYITNIRHM